ncbi:unnamed protein product [Victoria cruziana]
MPIGRSYSALVWYFALPLGEGHRNAPFVHFNKGAACVKIGRDPVKLQKGLQEWKGAHLSFDVRVMRHDAYAEYDKSGTSCTV